MTRRILVGYVATDYGRDALNLAIALARGQDIELQVAVVAPQDGPYAGVYPHDRGYASILEEQLGQWLQGALEMIPDDVTAVGQVVRGESEAEGLIQAAEELDCFMIVVGAREGGVLRRYRVGSVAAALLHSSPVPVALAPHGYRQSGPISRITCMFGPKPGAVDVIGLSVQAARRRSAGLRLVSLLLVGNQDEEQLDDSTRAMNLGVLQSVTRYGNERLGETAQEMVEAGTASTQVVTGKTVDYAMDELDWEAEEVAVVGSSRMAARGRLFLGSTAAKMLRSIPVPMVVVPAGYTGLSTHTAEAGPAEEKTP